MAKPSRRSAAARRRPSSTPQGALPQNTAGSRWQIPGWLPWCLLLVVLLVAYSPAIRGAFLWDDDDHVPKPGMRSWQGLCRILFEPGAAQQYYPLSDGAFWVMHRLWGDWTTGYHLATILAHFTAAWLVYRVCQRLAIPGGMFAAVIFALHPVHVESVAWITELKNTMSAVFYLAALLVYLDFDRDRDRRSYGIALGLFVLALLSKSVTATLPGALLVILWWQRGRLGWTRDVLPLLPFVLLGAVDVAVTAYVEWTFVGASGQDFALTGPERLLIAGRAPWFYLAKLLWPLDLVFVYPRWELNPAQPWQYAYLLATVGLLGVLWLIRRWTRSPLAAILFFGGTLVPVLGLVNVYFFKYSFVADHFQYLASLGIIVPVAAAATLWADRGGVWQSRLVRGLCLTLVAVLAVLTWRQARIYKDSPTLYRDTLEGNPECVLAHYNLGIELGNSPKALDHFQEALRLKPDMPEAYINSGVVLAALGRVPEALQQFQEGLRLKPDSAKAYNTWGRAMADLGQTEEAIAKYRDALRVDPLSAEAENNWGLLLFQRGEVTEAKEHYRRATELQPDFAMAYNNLGNAERQLGQIDQALAHYALAVQCDPGCAEAHNNWGVVLQSIGQPEQAVAHYREALRLNPNLADAQNNWGITLAMAGRLAEAVEHFREAVRLNPQEERARKNLEQAEAELQR